VAILSGGAVWSDCVTYELANLLNGRRFTNHRIAGVFSIAPGPLATNAAEPGIAARHRKLASRLLIVLDQMVEVWFDIAHLVTPVCTPVACGRHPSLGSGSRPDRIAKMVFAARRRQTCHETTIDPISKIVPASFRYATSGDATPATTEHPL
jgi:hypothetical protein